MTISMTIEVNAAIFRSPFRDNHFYVVGRDDMDFIEFMKRYNQGDKEFKRATGVNMDGTESNFYLVFVEDCFDPPIAIIRADSELDVEEMFVDSLPWSHISEPDLKDYNPETMSYGPSGQPYDSESIRIRHVKLHGVEID